MQGALLTNFGDLVLEGLGTFDPLLMCLVAAHLLLDLIAKSINVY